MDPTICDPVGAGTSLDRPATQPCSEDRQPEVEGETAASDPAESPTVLTILDREFSLVDGTNTGYRIPDGSRIRYSLGYTEVYGPAGTRIATISDDHAAAWFIPTGNRSATGSARCTHSIEDPNGTHIFHGIGFDSLSVNPDGTNPFVTIEYALPPQTQPEEYTPEGFIPAPRGEDQWVADFSKHVSPDIQEVRASWSVDKSPKWPDIATGVTEPGGVGAGASVAGAR